MKKLILALAVAVTAQPILAADCAITTSKDQNGEYTKTLATLSVAPGESVIYLISHDRTMAARMSLIDISPEELPKYNGYKVVAFYRAEDKDATNSILLATIQAPSQAEPDRDWFVNKVFAAGEWSTLMFLADDQANLAAACLDGMYPNQ